MEVYGFEERRICERLRYEGVPVLNLAFSFHAYVLFEKIAEGAFEWAKSTLYENVCREYESDPDPKKRFCFGYDYVFSCKLCFMRDGLLSAVIKTTLKMRKSRKTVAENNFGIVIRDSDGAILPLASLADKKTVSAYRKIGARSFYLDDGGIVALFSDGGEARLSDNISDIWSRLGKKC